MSGFTQIVDAFASEAAVEVSRMFGSDALKAGGKVFAMLVKGRLVVKLSASKAEELIAGGVASAFDPGHGRPMKQWVAIAPEHEWLPLAREAFVFACASGASVVSKAKRRAPVKGDG